MLACLDIRSAYSQGATGTAHTLTLQNLDTIWRCWMNCICGATMTLKDVIPLRELLSLWGQNVALKFSRGKNELHSTVSKVWSKSKHTAVANLITNLSNISENFISIILPLRAAKEGSPSINIDHVQIYSILDSWQVASHNQLCSNFQYDIFFMFPSFYNSYLQTYTLPSTF